MEKVIEIFFLDCCFFCKNNQYFKKTDVIYRLIDDVRERTNEYLQPNPGLYILFQLLY